MSKITQILDLEGKNFQAEENSTHYVAEGFDETEF